MTNSTVYLIGAGPGDPGLITVRGLQCLDVGRRRALRPSGARRACSATRGPTPRRSTSAPLRRSRSSRKRSAICSPRKRARARPWRGSSGAIRSCSTAAASEALFLHEQGVRFEVVPGIPAAIAVPGLRRHSDHLSGRRRHADLRARPRGRGQDARVDRLGEPGSPRRHDRLLRRAGSSCRSILDALLSHGRPADDSAAIVYDGTLPTQQTIDGIARRARRAARASRPTVGPPILVVGRVVALREHLRWFDARPLFGKRVLVTRPREQAAELVERLEAMGAEAIEAPMIRILPPDDYAPLDEACARAGAFDWIVFTSANAVDAFMERLRGRPARRARARRRQAVRGRAGRRRSG